MHSLNDHSKRSSLLNGCYLNKQITLQNSVVVAPMTMCYASDHHMPTPKMLCHYESLASSRPGLIVSEATMVNKEATGYPNTPGIYHEEQTELWKPICEKVKMSGSHFFCQLWHAGCMSHSYYRQGKEPIAASAIAPLRKIIPRTNGQLTYGEPREIQAKEIDSLLKDFIKSGQNALKAGFSGVEIHAANGYLLDSFLHYHTNCRKDKYGGNAKNMCRLVLEVVDVLINSIGAERVAIRLSPVPVTSMENMQEDVRDQHVFIHLLKELEKRKIAYVHISSDDDHKECGTLGMAVSAFARRHFSGKLIACGSYDLETGSAGLEAKQFDAVAFGRPFLNNPRYLDLLK